MLGIALGYKLAESAASRTALKIQQQVRSELAPLRAETEVKIAAIREARKKLDALGWNAKINELNNKGKKD